MWQHFFAFAAVSIFVCCFNRGYCHLQELLPEHIIKSLLCMVWLWTLISSTSSHLLVDWTVTCFKHVLHPMKCIILIVVIIILSFFVNWTQGSSTLGSRTRSWASTSANVLSFSKFSITIGIGFQWWFSTLYSYLLHTLFRGNLLNFRRVFNHCESTPPSPVYSKDDFQGAIKALPRHLRLLWCRSLASHLWNRLLSLRRSVLGV